MSFASLSDGCALVNDSADSSFGKACVPDVTQIAARRADVNKRCHWARVPQQILYQAQVKHNRREFGRSRVAEPVRRNGHSNLDRKRLKEIVDIVQSNAGILPSPTRVWVSASIKHLVILANSSPNLQLFLAQALEVVDNLVEHRNDMVAARLAVFESQDDASSSKVNVPPLQSH